MSTTPKIIIRTPNWLGDLMMSTAFIQKVLELYPDSQVDIIVRKGFENLPLPQRGKILPFDKNAESASSFGKKLRAEAYDIFYVLPPSLSSAMMAWASRAKTRIGHAEAMRSFFLKPAIPYGQKHRSIHLIQEYLELLGEKESFPHLAVTKDWIQENLKPAHQQVEAGFIAFCPGAVYGPAKQWPMAHVAGLIRKLVERGERVLVLGQKGDFEDPMEGLSNPENYQNLTGETNLNQFVAMLAKAKLLVSNDSGSMHVMAALQKPQIAIFGSTSTIWTGPINRSAKIITHNLDCAPCFKRECPYGHYDCLQGITPDEVLQHIK